MKNNCYQCCYRRSIPGDCHSRCAHPLVSDLEIADLLIALSNPSLVTKWDHVILTLAIEANEHGFKQGWFFWPFNFDPVWLQNCNGFKTVDEE